MRITVRGLDELRAALSGIDIDGAVQDAIAETALTIEQQVVLGIQRGPASGRVYEKYNPRRTHQASAPGEAPASDTGALAASVYSDISPMRAVVGSPLGYASYLEFGTRRMAARPIWRPVAEREAPKLRERIEENIAREVT